MIVAACVLMTQCSPHTPYAVTSSEAASVLQLSPEKQIDAYLERLKETMPPNPELAFIIAPNLDIQNHLEPRITAEKDDLVTSDLLFLARVVCEQHGGCSQNRSLIEEMRKRCRQITNPSLRESACGQVDKIENRKL